MKKFLSLALVAVMAVSAAACGGPAEQAATDSEASGSSNSEVFKIGGIGPTTGNTAIYGISAKNGIQIAVDEINEAGGINGYQLDYQFEDDENDSEKSVNAYNTLKDNGMQILIGTVTTTPCISVIEKTKEDNMFQLTPSASAVEAIATDNAFRICFSDPNQGVAAAQYIGEHDLASKIAIIYDSSDTYSTGIYEKFKEEAANQGLDIVAEEAFTADSRTDFSVQLQKAKDEGAELLFLPFYYTEASLVLTQAASMNYAPMFFGVDGMDGILTVENFDTSLAEGVMLLTPFAADSADMLTQNFVSKYEEKYGETPTQFAADGYDCVYTLKAAIEESGVTPDMSISDICEALKTVMPKISVDGLTGSGITWTEDGEPSKEPKAVVIKDGAYAAMD